MNAYRTLAAATLVATTVLSGCESVRNPVEPDARTVQRSEDLIDPVPLLIGSVVAGHEEHSVSFEAVVPAEGMVSSADSLLVSTVDLLNSTTGSLTSRLPVGALFATSSEGTTSGSIEDGEEMAVSGKIKTKTSKLTYDDGSTAWRTETTVSDFQGKGKKSGDTCRQNEQFNFQGDNPGGATTFTQVVQSVLVCQGSGRQFLLHINLHFTVTPNGQVTSNVENINVKGESGTN